MRSSARLYGAVSAVAVQYVPLRLSSYEAHEAERPTQSVPLSCPKFVPLDGLETCPKGKAAARVPRAFALRVFSAVARPGRARDGQRTGAPPTGSSPPRGRAGAGVWGASRVVCALMSDTYRQECTQISTD